MMRPIAATRGCGRTSSAVLPGIVGATRGIAATTGVVDNDVTKDGPLQVPNRFTQYYQLMKQTCPDRIRNYARCVARANNSEDDEGGGSGGSGLAKGACEEEFRQVKECFRSVRRAHPYARGLLDDRRRR